MTQPDPLAPEDWALWDLWMRAQRLLAREIDHRLQTECGISKAEFSVLVSLLRASGPALRVVDLVESLGWEKSRVAHQLTRMEGRGLVQRTESGARGRRTGVGLTAEGRCLAESAVLAHGETVRRCFLDHLTPDQAAAIRAWSEQTITRGDAR